MKKILILFTVFTSSLCKVDAQSDLQVMLKQIALIAVHVKELENAIEIARDGLATIHDIKNGEFNLHNLFFSSLKSVNPAVAKYSGIAMIVSDEVALARDFKRFISRMEMQNRLTASEFSYIESVYTHMMEECMKTLDNLIAVTTTGSLEMTDDERIKRIDGIYNDMHDKYAFSRQFVSSADQLLRERASGEKELRLLKTLQ